MTKHEIVSKVYGKVKFLSDTVFQTSKGVKYEIAKAFAVNSEKFFISAKQIS